jgi:hypothetical protein
MAKTPAAGQQEAAQAAQNAAEALGDAAPAMEAVGQAPDPAVNKHIPADYTDRLLIKSKGAGPTSAPMVSMTYDGATRGTRIADQQRRAILYARLARVTAGVKRIPKNGHNTYHNYRYAYESDITDGLRDLLLEHGIAFLPPELIDYEIIPKTSKIGDVARIKMRFTLADIETGEMIETVLIGEGQDGGDKAFYKAYTGAVKYFLCKTFLIATGDDPEATAPQNQPSNQPADQAPPAPPTAREIAISSLKDALRMFPKDQRPQFTRDQVDNLGTDQINAKAAELATYARETFKPAAPAQ